jgi:hypothetical protein
MRFCSTKYGLIISSSRRAIRDNRCRFKTTHRVQVPRYGPVERNLVPMQLYTFMDSFCTKFSNTKFSMISSTRVPVPHEI